MVEWCLGGWPTRGYVYFRHSTVMYTVYYITRQVTHPLVPPFTISSQSTELGHKMKETISQYDNYHHFEHKDKQWQHGVQERDLSGYALTLHFFIYVYRQTQYVSL